MLQLPDVTLVMIETREHELARMAIEDCLAVAAFGDVVVFSDRLDGWPPSVDMVVEVPDWPSKEGWSQFLWNHVGGYVKTSHMLSIQWDSWIVEPRAWISNFLRYDYIGAPWWYTDGLNVGNGGFSLRSTALQRYCSKHRDRFPCVNAIDDDQLCRKYRIALQERGFRWAPQEIAERFAFECMAPVPNEAGMPFGFHGIFNWPKVLDEERLRERVRIAAKSDYIKRSPQMWAQLLKVYPEAVSL